MRPTSQEITTKLAHLLDDSQDLLDQLAQNKFEQDKLNTQLTYISSPVSVSNLKLEFPSDEQAKVFGESLDEDGEDIFAAEVHGSAVLMAFTSPARVYVLTESLIESAKSYGGFIPTVLTEFDSKVLGQLNNQVRVYVYGDASDSESEQQQPSL